MVRNSKLPDIAMLEEHRTGGMSISEIGDKYGVTGEAVRMAYKRNGVELPRERNDHARFLPWRIRADHAHDLVARRLRALSKREQGGTLKESEEKLLDEWLEWMDGANSHGIPLSVHYDRTDPEGFWFEPRKPGDRDYISPPKATRRWN